MRISSQIESDMKKKIYKNCHREIKNSIKKSRVAIHHLSVKSEMREALEM